MQRLGSSWRTRPAADTLQAALPLMQPLGISRLSEITRMDRLGLPVFASVRPRGRALRVHAGKGIDALDARVGALMEAVEYAVAEPERTPWTAVPMAIGRFLAQFGGRLDLLDFAPLLGRPITHDDVLLTVACEDLVRGSSVHLPAELVFLPFERSGEPPFFGWTSNGLASGNTPAEATLHALLEVVERDALTMQRALDQSLAVDVGTLPPPFDALVDAWQRQGVRTALRWLPGIAGVVCFEACLHEPANEGVPLAGGSGAHLDAGVALARAICEAAQSRLSHIHGARDDVTHFFDRHTGRDAQSRAAADAALLQHWFGATPGTPLAALPLPAMPPVDVDGIEAALQGVLQALAAAGFDQVYRHRFAASLPGLHVVKVVVAGCEDVGSGPRRMGRRLFTRLTGGPPA